MVAGTNCNFYTNTVSSVSQGSQTPGPQPVQNPGHAAPFPQVAGIHMRECLPLMEIELHARAPVPHTEPFPLCPLLTLTLTPPIGSQSQKVEDP